MQTIVSNSKIIKRKALLIYTTVPSVNEKLEQGIQIEGILYCNLIAGKAAFNSETPIFFDYVKSIDVNENETIEIITFDDDEWIFGLE